MAICGALVGHSRFRKRRPRLRAGEGAPTTRFQLHRPESSGNPITLPRGNPGHAWLPLAQSAPQFPQNGQAPTAEKRETAEGRYHTALKRMALAEPLS